MKDFRDLRVWSKSHQLTLQIYAVTANFPKYELYGPTSQIRRSSASIGANIAEGCGKRGNAEFQRYLQIASGSTSELEYHLLLSRDLGFLSPPEHILMTKQLIEMRKMLTALLQKIETERHTAKYQVPSAKC